MSGQYRSGANVAQTRTAFSGIDTFRAALDHARRSLVALEGQHDRWRILGRGEARGPFAFLEGEGNLQLVPLKRIDAALRLLVLGILGRGNVDGLGVLARVQREGAFL